MRDWRDRWSTTPPVATARPPIDCSSTQATPRAKTSLRWQAHAAGSVSVHTPPPGERDEVKPATLARRIGKREKDPACLKAWRERIASEAGQAVYAFRPEHRADQRRPQEPRLRFSCRARAHQGQGPRALSRHRQQPHGRPRLERQCLAPLPSGQSAPKERLTRTGLIHDPDHSSITAPNDRGRKNRSLHTLEIGNDKL